MTLKAPVAFARKFLLISSLLAALAASAAAQEETEDTEERPAKAGLTLLPATEPKPDKPWNIGFIDEVNPTPESQPNPSAEALNRYLGLAMKNQLEKSTVRKPWQDYAGFLDWAVWGYLSADSKFKGDPVLITMIQEWFDRQFVLMKTPPEDPAKAAKWGPDRLGQWRFEVWSLPMLELEIRPDLQKLIGQERFDRFRKILLQNSDATFEESNLQALLNRITNTINFAMHPIASPVHGWVLTGDEKKWLLAENSVAGLERFLLPDGMFAYQKDPGDPTFVSTETPYYHAINIAGLYMYWWATKSARAEEIFRKSIPYYLLNFEPPANYNGGTDIWWKDQWRPFWAAPVAMVAAVTGDGQNARLANEMARRRVETDDAYYLTLGAHAYLQMGLKKIAEKPFDDNFIRVSPDIRGVRTRWGNWSTTFTGGAFNYTRVSAMLVDPEAKGQNALSALHMARPLDRASEMRKAPVNEQDLGVAGRDGIEYSLAKTGEALAFAATYRLRKTSQTWVGNRAEVSKWQTSELWISTPQGLIGLMRSELTDRLRAYEFSHQYRFIVPGNGDANMLETNIYQIGGMRFRVWQTSFPHAIAERVRRHFQGDKDRRDWQLSLSDSERSPEQILQNAKTPEEKKAAIHPADKLYNAGTQQFSVVEISPQAQGGWDEVARADSGPLLGLDARKGKARWLAIYNPGSTPHDYKIPDGASLAAASWDGAKAATENLPIPAAGVALFSFTSAPSPQP